MRRLALFAPLAASLALAGAVNAQPDAAPQVTVTIGGDLIEDAEKIGRRDVDLQLAELRETVERTLARRGALAGARVNLVVTDLKPNRPTMQQAMDRPGLSVIDSRSIGGATIEGEIVTADGRSLPVRYDRYSTSITEVRNSTTWYDADRAFDRLAVNLAEGRYVTR